MLKKTIFTMIVMLFMAFSQVGNASCYIQELLNNIHLNESYCVSGYEKGKIYIDPESIYIGEDGVRLFVNDETSYALPYLFSDANGCYLWDEFSGTGVPPFPLVYCSKCGYDHMPPPHK